MGKNSNRNHRPNPVGDSLDPKPEPVLCALCARTAQFLTTEKYGNMGEVQVLNKSNFIVGEDENGTKLYAHSVCYNNYSKGRP